jgi:hypothetical protein
MALVNGPMAVLLLYSTGNFLLAEGLIAHRRTGFVLLMFYLVQLRKIMK